MEDLPIDIIECVLDELCPHHPELTPSSAWPARRAIWSVAEIVEIYGRRCEEKKQIELQEGNFAALGSLCRASKRLNALATRRLYHTVVESWQPSHPLQRHHDSLCSLLARTLVARPDLARLVRHIRTDRLFKGWLYGLVICDRAGSKKPGTLVCDEVQDYFKERAAVHRGSWSYSFRERERTGLRDYMNCQDVALSIVLSLCPSLQTLDFHIRGDGSAPFSLCDRAAFPSLQAVQLRASDANVAFFANLWRMAPNLRAILLTNSICPRWNDDRDAAFREACQDSGFTHVTDVDLTCVYIRKKGLAFILRICPGLKRLRILSPRGWDGELEGEGRVVMPIEVVECVHLPATIPPSATTWTTDSTRKNGHLRH